SPGWVKYIETFYPDLLDYVSTCKSPQEMTGAMIKSYFAEKMNIDPANIFVVSVMPCTAKKFESQRPELGDNYPDVDAVLTTREMGRMIKNAGLDFAKLPDDHFDDPMGESTGAAVIFGTTGGVMEAALRTAHYYLTESEMEKIDFSPIRGLEGVKEATVEIKGQVLNIAAVSGLHNINRFLEDIKSGKSKYHFIEVMACPGGCINGGGQPLPTDPDKVRKRAEGIYSIDRGMAKRASHHNESVQKLYKEFLGEPNGHKAHELLHTRYLSRDYR
ncbi:ferredoxin, partial [candidate division KSB1 bacterium]|nr:ferredoxin [candidate division KSB1 bacterium]